jgi:AP-1 complex subunit sigma 1/2
LLAEGMIIGKLVSKEFRYASLYFISIVDKEDNE